MAGAGFKTFNTGDVLTASDVNTYLMQQTVMVFDDAAARTTALTGVVAEGMLSYLKDTNAVEVYDGSSWVASDDPNAIQNSIVDAKGDLISATADNTPARLAVGADNTVLTADSSTSTGLKWAAAAAGGDNWSLLNSGGTALTGAATITVSGISGKNKIMVLLDGATSASASSYISIRVNGSSSSIYYFYGQEFVFLGTYNSGMLDAIGIGSTEILMGRMSDSAAATVEGGITFSGCNSSGVKQFILNGTGSAAGITHRGYNLQGYVDTSSTISSISVVSGTGNFDAGTVYVYTTA
jgi:hypothetical protein